jgi:predicted DNA-binding WGR domain protein
MTDTDDDQLDIFPDQICLRKLDQETNTARFYYLTAQRDLFGFGRLTIEFGRIGQAGRVIVRHFAHEAEALNTLAIQFVKRGAILDHRNAA